MRRVLIITYYWPPNGGAGVYRWLKFSKYLPPHGWEPVVYTPSNPELTANDPGLLRDVHAHLEVVKRPISEPYTLYKRLTGRKVDEKVETAFLSEKKRKSWRDDLALWVRSNFFVPDARVAWVRPSIAFLKNYLKEHPVDAIITTGPPHSMHLIGLGLKRALGVKWIADFRDPWTNIDFYQQLKLTGWADRRHRRQERSVLQTADRVVTVSWTWAKDLEQLGAREVAVITNGFDTDDLPAPPVPVDEAWSLVHVGAMTATRDCPALWKRFSALCASDPEFGARFKLRFVGPADHSIIESVRAAGLMDKVERLGRVSHDEAMREMQRARVLLLPINDTPNKQGILPGKVFEYLAVGRPILAVGPAKGDVVRVLGDGHLQLDREGSEQDDARILALFRGSDRARTASVRSFDRRNLAGEVAQLLEKVVASQPR